MKKIAAGMLVVMFVLWPLAVKAAEFTLYPGAKIDQKLTEESRQMAEMMKKQNPGMAASIGIGTVYSSPDSFDKVYAFYKKIATEYQMPGRTPGKPKKLPDGRPLYEAYFIFDGASDLASSRLWAKIQRPMVADLNFEDIRDLTSIVVSERK